MAVVARCTAILIYYQYSLEFSAFGWEDNRVEIYD